MKKIIILFLMLFLLVPTAIAKEKTTAIAGITDDFDIQNIPEKIKFQLYEDLKIDEERIIPANSFVYAKVVRAQKELRWHKSGFILCKLDSYISLSSEEEVDISDKEIFILARKYEKVYAKEATILGTEIVLSQGASFFAPGVDILYFFTKGAIKKTTHPHWFKAGVSYAYENSICWFWLKGKPINLDIDDEIEVKEIEEKKALKVAKKVDKRNNKYLKKQEKKELKRQKKELKQKEKLYNKELKNQRLLGV